MTKDTDNLTIAYSRLGCMLDESAAFESDVTQLLEAAWGTSTVRQTICFAYCKAALEHAVSQRTLLGIGKSGTALALTRLHFETVVRAAWINLAASDQWLSEFAAPVVAGDFNEPILGPPIPAMLDSIALKQPELVRELRKLNETVKVMHSFVHGGVHLVAHSLRGYPPENLISLMQNRNLLTLQLCNVIVVASGRPSLLDQSVASQDFTLTACHRSPQLKPLFSNRRPPNQEQINSATNLEAKRCRQAFHDDTRLVVGSN